MTTATIHLDIMVTCPNEECEEYLNLFSELETGVINDEGELWELVRKTNYQDWKNLGIKCVCWKCKTEFVVDEMESIK
jgi:hypothetical protein